MSNDGAPDYPAGWDSVVVLEDGSTVQIRPIRPDDRDRLDAFHHRQSPESIYLRFFQYRPDLSDRELEFFTKVDYQERMAFVAILGDELVAVARYETLRDQNVAEVAFFVDDRFHGRGLATLLLEYLAAAGRRRGLDGFTASVLPENYGMLRVFRKAGFAVSTAFADGVIEVILGIELTEETDSAIRARDQAANAKSISRLLQPSSVAVIGVSRRANSIGQRLLRDLVAARFGGTVQVVNPSGAVIAGVESVASVDELTMPVDLAVVVAPAAEVEGIVTACAGLGVGGLVVISAGFSEAGPKGADRERRLLDVVRSHGLRLIGPNAFGVANTDPQMNLRALFLPVEIKSGTVGLLSQSGPLGAALLARFTNIDLGVSTFVAVGNRADVSVNDLLQYWAEDDRTEVIALYLENVGNVAKFTRLARTISATKPIIAVEPPDPGLRELLSQSGVLLVREVAELADQANLAVHQPLPSGARVVVVSNASSVARLAAAACRAAGLELVVPSGVQELAEGSADSETVLVGDADRVTTGRAGALSDHERLIVAAAVSAEVDCVLLAMVPTEDLPIESLTALLARIDRAVGKPMVATGLTGVRSVDVPGLPVFDFPESAARALGRWVSYGQWLRRDRGPAIELGNDEELTSMVSGLLDDAERLAEANVRGDSVGSGGAALPLDSAQTQELLRAIGIDYGPTVTAYSKDETVDSARQLGYPVALKAGGLNGRVAGESGGTALDLQNESQLVAAFSRMEQRLPNFYPALVQSMVPTGHHLRVVLEQSSSAGARLLVGMGGSSAVGSPDLGVQVLPAGAHEIAALVSLPWLSALGAAENEALHDLLTRLAGAASLLPELSRIELNPVLVSDDRAVAVEADAALRRVQPGLLDDVRHLESGPN